MNNVFSLHVGKVHAFHGEQFVSGHGEELCVPLTRSRFKKGDCSGVVGVETSAHHPMTH